ncbi:glycoside hydrolase family 92 protein [Roridomyces roridus]|uniref:Glycoside hydrolase family 92 protein n=1 Tax=Roridomyces roridus TaxID=1738132 RepID=A0AAD7BM81_9AGAR|nr:glycoside hydrolase family 92 protein [Roridomyces roridus]
MQQVLPLAGVLAAIVVAVSGANVTDPLSHVNLFIGTLNGGNVFPGATVPHGMVKVGMDTDGNNFAGYDPRPEFNVTGFSQLHQSGTGGAVPLSNFKLFPIPECFAFEQCLTTIASRKTLRNILPDGTPDDFASPGYFSTNLSTGVRVELAATRRTGLHRYTFPANSTTPRILLDVTNDGQVSGIMPTLNIDHTTGRMKASGNFATSFGPGRYNAYTCVDFQGEGYSFKGPTEWGPYKINYPDKNGVDLAQHYYSYGSEYGGLLSFPPNPNGGPSTILARVGISLISTAQACKNAESEIDDFDFDRVVSDAEGQWRDILSRVDVDTEGVDAEMVELLYSSLYRTHIVPGDYTGENPGWKSSEPYYDAFYCNWDTYRTLFPLMSLHDPENFARIVRGMIDIQKHEGWLPEAREAGQPQFIQGGSNGDPILAEFFVKFSDHASALGVSADDLYNALLADAENTPENWNIQGRQADVWKALGYIPSDTTYPGGANTKQVSRALEYAFDDFSISQVAKILGKKADATKYVSRAQNYHNSWNPNITVPDVTDVQIAGFFQPRFANGTWNYTDPRHCSVNDPTKATCFLNAIRRDGFYESSPIVYSQYVPQDTANLIELQGGNERFIERLNWIFDQNYFDSTDEPSQQIPFMYHYANAPGLSTQRSRQVIATWFNTSLSGLPGNDDSGAMASYVIFYLAGLYPLPATKQFLLSSPYFPRISFYNPLFKTTTTIKTINFVANPANGTGGTVFVKSVKVNGKPYKSSCYLEWDVFTSGSTVELEVTDDINVQCGNGKNALPPSLSTGGYD